MRYLLLHGFTGTPESFTSLAAPDGSVAATLAGHLDEAAAGDFEHEVDRLLELADGCTGLLGYSLGGRLALGLLARAPERFQHAVLVSAHPGLATADERQRRRAGDSRLITLLRERGLPAFLEHWQALPLWASQGALPDATRQWQREQRMRHHAEGLAQSLLQHGLAEMPDLRPRLGALRARVDVVAGERDEKFCLLGRELRALIPSSSLTIAGQAGHNLLLERPELVSALLSRGASA